MQDSYFGEIGNSFYAGPNGQSFKINEQGHFNNRAQLNADIALGWASPIQPNDYVIISYGYPGDPLGPDDKNDYIRNSEIDAPNNYNSTVWQKTYNASQQILSYELIVSLQGVTPYIEFTADELNPTSATKVSLTGPTGTPDNPEYVLHVAKAWEIEEGLCEVLGADGDALIAFNRKSDNGDLTPLSDTTKYLHVCLPQTWDIVINETAKRRADEGISFTGPSITNDEQGRAKTKTWTVAFPKPYNFDVAYNVLSADSEPTLTKSSLVEGSTQDTYTFTFGLPRAWDINITEGSKLPADESPTWTDTTDQSGTTKSWVISLPKAYQLQVAKTVLNPAQNPTVSRSVLTDEDTYTFTFGLPKAWDINITRGTDVDANQSAEWRETTGQSQTTKSWELQLPKPYQFDVTSTVLNPTDTPTVSKSELSGGDTYTFTFGLPQAWNINITEGAKLSANTSPRWSGPSITQSTKTWTIQLPKAYDFNVSTTVLEAGENPTVSLGALVSGENVDTYPLDFSLPAPWDISIQNGARVAADQAPIFQLISSNNNTKLYQIQLARGYNLGVTTVVAAPNVNPSVAKGTLTTLNNIDTQEFIFTLPQAWQILLTGNTSLDANQNPILSSPIDDLTNGTRTWTLSLPKSYLFTASTGAALNADASATVSLGSLAADGRTLPLTFQFPAPWAIAANAIIQDPTFEPIVSTSDDHQTKTFTFSLPRAWQITAEKGATLAAGSEPTVSEVLVNSYTKKFVFSMPATVAFLTGSGAPVSVASDTYYINTANGDFYGHGDNNIPVKLFSFTPPTPDVATVVVNPYSQSGGSYTTVLPTVTGSQDSGTGKWIYSFTIPKMPTFSASTTTTGNGTLATLTAGPSANDAYNFAFSIPKGTFWFTGNEFTTSNPPTVQYAQTNNARNGDIYLNVDTGIMWKWNSTAWAVQSGTLKGPQGDGVEIVGKVFIDYHNNYIAAYKDGDPIPSAGDTGYVDGTTYYPAIYNETNLLVQTAEIIALLYPSGSEPDPDQIINIIGQDYRNTPTELLTPVYSSYWSYYLSPDWNVTPIGGGADSRLTWGFWDSSGLHR